MNVHFSSESNEWATPQALFDELNQEFGFTLDAAASDKNYKVSTYFTEKDDALTKDWLGTVWLNPPYGRQIKDFIAKAYSESNKHGSTIVCLIPSRTDTAYWHDYVMKAKEIRYIRGRLKFNNHQNSAPFPSAIVIF